MRRTGDGTRRRSWRCGGNCTAGAALPRRLRTRGDEPAAAGPTSCCAGRGSRCSSTVLLALLSRPPAPAARQRGVVGGEAGQRHRPRPGHRRAPARARLATGARVGARTRGSGSGSDRPPPPRAQGGAAHAARSSRSRARLSSSTCLPQGGVVVPRPRAGGHQFPEVTVHPPGFGRPSSPNLASRRPACSARWSRPQSRTRLSTLVGGSRTRTCCATEVHALSMWTTLWKARLSPRRARPRERRGRACATARPR